SLVQHTRPPYELILVKNGALAEPGPEGSEGEELSELVKELASRRGPVRVEVLPDAANGDSSAVGLQALARARGEWIVFLSDDAVLTPGWLEGLIGWATHDWPSVGLVGPMTNRCGSPQGVLVDYSLLADLPHFAARRKKEFAGKALQVE